MYIHGPNEINAGGANARATAFIDNSPLLMQLAGTTLCVSRNRNDTSGWQKRLEGLVGRMGGGGEGSFGERSRWTKGRRGEKRAE